MDGLISESNRIKPNQINTDFYYRLFCSCCTSKTHAMETYSKESTNYSWFVILEYEVQSICNWVLFATESTSFLFKKRVKRFGWKMIVGLLSGYIYIYMMVFFLPVIWSGNGFKKVMHLVRLISILYIFILIYYLKLLYNHSLNYKLVESIIYLFWLFIFAIHSVH